MEINMEEYERLMQRDVAAAVDRDRLERRYVEEHQLRLAAERRVQELEAMLEQVQDPKWSKTTVRYILILSVERVRDFLSHVREFPLRAVVHDFILRTQPPEMEAEQLPVVREITAALPPEEGDRVITVQGNYVDIHDNR